MRIGPHEDSTKRNLYDFLQQLNKNVYFLKWRTNETFF